MGVDQAGDVLLDSASRGKEPARPAAPPPQGGPARARAAGGRRSEATRYLLAAAHSDWRFRNQFLSRVEVDERLHAPSPETGVDRGLVIQECRKVRRQKTIRNALLLLAWVPLIGSGFLADLVAYPEFWNLVVEEYLGAITLAVIIAAAVVFGERTIDYVLAKRRLSPAGFAALPPSARPAEEGNVIAYSGFSPFVGAGQNLGGWSFAVNLARAKDEARPSEDFTVSELYGRLEESLRGLGLPNVGVEDRLFVEGCSLRDDRTLLPDIYAPPLAQAGRNIVEHYREHPNTYVRHYLCLEVQDWGGEIVVSVFLRFQKNGTKLFCEANYFLLPPLNEKCHFVDRQYPGVRISDIGRLLNSSLLLAIPMLLAAPVSVAASILRPVTRFLARREMRKAARFNPRFDYGAGQSMREKQAGTNYHVYFQRLDKEMHTKIVEQHIIDFITEFLGEHNVDTSELRAKAETIMNYGIIVSGGSVQAGSLAVGEGARAGTGRRPGEKPTMPART